MKIFVSGAISSNMEHYKEEFAQAQRELEALGLSVMNPAVLPAAGFDHSEYMQVSLAMQNVCDATLFLPSWQQSRGAGDEMKNAIPKSQLIFF